MTQLRVGVAMFAVLAAAACASTGQRPGDSGGGDENVITAAELRAAPQQNLLSFIQSHRPLWLQRRYGLTLSDAQAQPLTVFLDNSPTGGVDMLGNFTLSSVAEVRYYSPSEAESRFGVGYIAGVIQVISRSH